MSLKERISSPLEAGPSILDAHHLPPYLGPALEYTSSRLARKALHLTLVVVRRDYQLPSVPPPIVSPGLSTPSTPGSSQPATPSGRFTFATSPVAAFKSLVRSASCQDASPSYRPTEAQRSAASTPAHTPLPLDSPGLRLRWPLSPTAPLSPPPPMTPCTASSITTDATGSLPQTSFGMRFVHSNSLPSKDERTLRRSLYKAQQKYGIGNSWLSAALSPTSCGLTNHLVHNSMVQNEVLFSSEGLTLVSLDRLYSLKSALSSYSKTKSPMRLEDAVDELRRYVLSNNGIKVTKADLLRSYDWLSVSNSAISDLDIMYRRAYGGPDFMGAISGMPKISSLPIQSLPVHIRSDEDSDDDDNHIDDDEFDANLIGMAVTTAEESKPPTPRVPILKLQTSFGPKPEIQTILPSNSLPEEDDDEENDGDRTARPVDRLHISLQPWQSSSIDQVLSAGVFSPDRTSMAMRDGPMTPNGYEDISPVTRGEWGFLMVDDAFQSGRTVAVETF